jgi:hypothetical protein
MDAETADGARHYSSHMCQALGLAADPPRRYKSELLRSSGGGSETGCDRMAILSGRPAPVGWSEVQHRYYELDSRRTGLRWLTALIQKLWDVAWDMWDHRNRVLHDQEHSVARDLQIQQITDEFATGSVGLAREAKPLLRRTTISPTTAGLSNGMAHQNTSGTGTCRAT